MAKRLVLFIIIGLTALTTVAQTFSVEGRVVNEEEEPVIGASVYIDGTKRGTATDINNLRGYGDVLPATVDADAGTHTANPTTNVSGTIAADGTISGIRLNTTLKHINELPAGLYISDGKKFIIKK